jgi:hypothetical protein
MASSRKPHQELSLSAIIGAIVFIGLVLTLIPVAYVEYYHEPHAPMLRGILSLTERLGDAFIIAAILAVFVERAIGHEDFNRLIVRIFGKGLPSPLLDHIRTYFTWDFVRTNWNIVYTIEPTANPQGFSLQAVSSYEMQNVSDETKDYLYRYSVEATSDNDGTSKINKVVIDHREQDDLSSKITWNNGYIVFTDSVLLESKRKCAFESQSLQWFRDEKTSPYWALHPVVGATFTIFHPSDVTVEFDATFEDENPSPKDVDDKKPHLIGKRWIIETPILPGQGFTVRCGKVATA